MLADKDFLIYSENPVVQNVIGAIGFNTSTELSPVVDLAITNNEVNNIAKISVPIAEEPIKIKDNILRAINHFEMDVIDKCRVAPQSFLQRRILVWLYQAGSVGLSPEEIAVRIGGGESAANNVCGNVYTLRKMAVPRDIIISKNDRYFLKVR
ncbi:MAG: hypothetical protein LBB23_01945 [Rickettsiales bacterium]|jgi:hypothetical protein|nr:hypothetical protein [Rickettsiales bacterium]